MAPPRRPPSVDALLRTAEANASGLGARDRAAVRDVARAVVDGERVAMANGTLGRPTGALADELLERLEALERGEAPLGTSVDAGLVPVINATGVILHTNLGRAAWPAAAIEAARVAASRPSLLELDAGTGQRGRRFRAAEDEVI